eukprot:CAMPEP_0197024328 /NCGR_PEP_ID=MMETSP1384-20130603/4890_1 /TAXON_ID=29189 /ORGANISM="Ammonia sp." /LENGTH=587 /DNA_ID=CAMNT_0042452693 /DNA_START=53 /DNA_END=1816 /DNA_ORIENTATION=+
MFCSISNTICQHPVVSRKTGHIFEKDLLEKHLKIHKTCPVTSEAMSMEDVIEIKTTEQPSAPKQLSTTNIPSLLRTMQNEWDQLMIESYQIKKQLQDTRQQLSHSMYQYDAAIRVIARLTDERDRALQELANTRETMASAMSQFETMKAMMYNNNNTNKSNATNVQSNGKAARKNEQAANEEEEDDDDVDMKQDTEKKTKGQSDMEVDADAQGKTDENVNSDGVCDRNKLPEDLVSKITTKGSELAKHRKKEHKKAPPTLVSMEVINNEYKVCEKLSYTAHSTVDPGINCMDISPQYPHQRIVTGGNDAQIIVCNRSSKAFEYVLKGHSKPINDVKFHRDYQDLVFSASSDNSCVVWKLLEAENGGKYEKVWNLSDIYQDSVLSLSMHPLSDYFMSCARDGFWYFHCLPKKQTLLKVRYEQQAEDANASFQCMQVHPDGQLMAVSCGNKKVLIYDIRSLQVGYSMDCESISSMDFNENGYYFGAAQSVKENVVNIWDLRKIGKNQFLSQFEMEQRVRCIQFDGSGQYLGVGQPNGVSLYLSKKWSKFAEIECHRKDVSAIQFAKDAKFIVTASKDNHVKIISNHETI